MADKLSGHEVRDPSGLHARVEVQLDQAAQELTRRLSGRVGYDVVRRAVTDAYERLARHARVRNFLPILAARAAQQRLRAGR
ncbi:three-helix bundle dimerization domain-containing protein [Saccharothrix sp. Mg75]|uniref:three-helix bundle dimerization domain-containing protein n=1 Tax=Saccharothrix sp. Mg75 TaxID=3445357 RepID=UPI003EE82D24